MCDNCIEGDKIYISSRDRYGQIHHVNARGNLIVRLSEHTYTVIHPEAAIKVQIIPPHTPYFGVWSDLRESSRGFKGGRKMSLEELDIKGYRNVPQGRVRGI